MVCWSFVHCCIKIAIPLKTYRRKTIFWERVCVISVFQERKMGPSDCWHFASLRKVAKQPKLRLQFLQQPTRVLGFSDWKSVRQAARELRKRIKNRHPGIFGRSDRRIKRTKRTSDEIKHGGGQNRPQQHVELFVQLLPAKVLYCLH